MHRVLLLFFLLAAGFISRAQNTVKAQDYVPDEKTAVRIAEAALVARYGEERVNAQLPLHAIDNKADYWIVQGHGPGPATSKGGGLLFGLTNIRAA